MKHFPKRLALGRGGALLVTGLGVTLDNEAAATLSIGTIQGQRMQSLVAGDVEHIRHDAPRVFAIYQRGIRSAQ